jgi:phosphatidylinositol alpha-mannosyltransferase
MRILQVCPYAWDSPGGVQVHIRGLSRYLRQQGHDVRILAPARRPVEEACVWRAGRTLAVPYNGSIAPIGPGPAVAARVAHRLRAFDPDVVHVHEPMVPGASLFATLQSRRPVFATFHANAGRARSLRVMAPLARRVYARIDRPMAVSRAAARFIADTIGVPEPVVVPNGVDLDAFRRPAATLDGRPPTLLFVNRLDPRKGFGVLLAAFARASEALPDLRLVVAGDGPDRLAAAQLPAGLRSRIELLGDVPHADVPDVHARADLFVAPALGRESFGMVLVEAMAAGLPIVASAIPGYTEVVEHGRTAWLVRPGDDAALASAIVTLLRDPAARARLVAEADARVARYAWSTVGARVEQAYRAAVIPWQGVAVPEPTA